jgi:hypothetical protein
MAPAETASDRNEAGLSAMVHVGLWGGAAAACLLAVALATHTETGQSRLAAAYGAGPGGTQVAATAPRDADVDARRMVETIRNLTEDRDRLLARMTALERNYEDVTGSIGRLASPAKPPAEPVLPAQPPPPVDPAPVASIPVPAPAAAPPPTPSPGPAVKPASTPAPAVAPAPVATAAAPATPEPAEPVSARSEFGVDIGGGPTLASLRVAWDRVKRNHASLLDGLRPVIAVRDNRGGQVELRLVVGPIANAAAAARLCASLAAAGLSCQPTMFEGQRLALR